MGCCFQLSQGCWRQAELGGARGQARGVCCMQWSRAGSWREGTDGLCPPSPSGNPSPCQPYFLMANKIGAYNCVFMMGMFTAVPGCGGGMGGRAGSQLPKGQRGTWGYRNPPTSAGPGLSAAPAIPSTGWAPFNVPVPLC